MTRILDITFKDLLQLLRDFKTFLFLLIMPIVFTFLPEKLHLRTLFCRFSFR